MRGNSHRELRHGGGICRESDQGRATQMRQDDRGSTSPPREDDTDLTIRNRTLRRKIIDIAKHRFARSGYEQVSLQDVAAAADLKKERLMLYFPDKGGLLRVILDDSWE